MEYKPAFRIGEKKVLALGSYDVGYFSFDAQKEGIDSLLDRNNVHTDYEFLNARTDASETHFEHMRDIISLGHDMDMQEEAIRYERRRTRPDAPITTNMKSDEPHWSIALFVCVRLKTISSFWQAGASRPAGPSR